MNKNQNVEVNNTNEFESLEASAKKGKKKKEPKKQKLSGKTIQGIMPFVHFYEDGLMKVSGREYSKLYKLQDANFITENEEKQEAMLLDYQKLLNKFPENVSLTIAIINQKQSTQDLIDAYHIQEKDCDTDELARDYNAVIDEKINEGGNNISKDKYLILTINTASYESAVSTLSSIQNELQECVKNINRSGVKEVSLIERLKVMYAINHGCEGISFDKQYEKFYTDLSIDKEGKSEYVLNRQLMKKAGVTVKDMIAPTSFNKEKGYIQLAENRYCKSELLTNLPLSLDTKFVTEITNIPCEMVTTIRFSAVPKKKAVNLVKVQNVSVKADVLKRAKMASKEGVSSELYVDEDLQVAQQQAKQIRNDVMIEGKKLFYVTIVSTLIGEDIESTKKLVEQLDMKLEDFSMKAVPLLGQQVEAWRTQMLTGTTNITLDRLLTSDSAVALFPFNIQEIQDRGGHFYGINSVSKNMIMYNRKTSSLANGLIFGQSGSGKSFITKGEVIPNLLDGDDEMIILDPENEYRLIAERFNGNVIDLKPKSDLHINPCDLNMEFDEPDASPLVEKCDFMVGLVESILGNGRECNSFEVNVIHRATNKMYEEYISIMEDRRDKGIKQNIDPEICPTLVDFYNELLADNSPEGNKVAMAIEPYCIGNYNIFAHRTNIDTSKKITVYNLLYLPEKMQEMAMKVCLSNIWTKIVKNREQNEKNGTNKAIWVYLDEFHLFFKTLSSANSIKAYYKRVRKYNGIMTGITQDVSDLTQTSQGASMFDNTGFFIFLKQSKRGRDSIQSIFGASDSLIDNVKDKPSGVGLIYNGVSIVPFNYRLQSGTALYKLMSTNPNDKNKDKGNETVQEETTQTASDNTVVVDEEM